MNVDLAPNTIEEFTQTLITNLTHQEQGMADLKTHIEEQLNALRSQERSTLETLTAETSSIISSLQTLQIEKEKHLTSFSKILELDPSNSSLESIIKSLERHAIEEGQVELLKQLNTTIPLTAQAIKERSKELAYSLQYALHLGHQMIEAIQGAVSYPPILVYTAEGNKKLSASKRMMVNKVG